MIEEKPPFDWPARPRVGADLCAVLQPPECGVVGDDADGQAFGFEPMLEAGREAAHRVADIGLNACPEVQRQVPVKAAVEGHPWHGGRRLQPGHPLREPDIQRVAAVEHPVWSGLVRFGCPAQELLGDRIPADRVGARTDDRLGCSARRCLVGTGPGDQAQTRFAPQQTPGRRGRTRPIDGLVARDAEPVAAAGLERAHDVGLVGRLEAEPPELLDQFLLERLGVDRDELRNLIDNIARRRVRVDPADQVPAGLQRGGDRAVVRG